MSATYDALNRIKLMRQPQDVEGQRKTLRPHYNRAGALERVTLDGTTYVERLAYDAKGQRSLIAYGNGVMTRYGYDPRTFRLTRLRSERYTKPNALTYHPIGQALQDFGYGYDLAGNILSITDRTPESGILNNPQAAGEPDSQLALLLASGNALVRRFDYDPIYRLTSATGRECDRPPDGPRWLDQPRCMDLTRTRGYTQRYQYDAMGSVLRLQHQSEDGGFMRFFTVENQNNRLKTLTIGATDYDYRHDANGNMTAETSSRHFEWDHSDHMKAFRTQTEGAEPSVHAHYLYDAIGQRVKKLVRKQGGQVDVTHYLDGMFEHHRRVQGPALHENNTLHVMDDQSRVALVRLGDAFPEDVTPAVKYQLGDHLGSSNVVVSNDGIWINREEFTPYGESSFGSFARKRYRFTGKERDEESGLTYHRARYFAGALCRWISCDPIGASGGLNVLSYVNGNPMRNIDPDGTQPWMGEALGEWDTMGEMVVGGHWNSVDESHTVVEPAEGGFGGIVGGVCSAATFRLCPTEDNPSSASKAGMDLGASFVPLSDPFMRMITGETVSGANTSRAWAAVEFGLDVLNIVPGERALAKCNLGEDPTIALQSFKSEGRLSSFENDPIWVEGQVTRKASAPEATRYNVGMNQGGVEVGFAEFRDRNPTIILGDAELSLRPGRTKCKNDIAHSPGLSSFVFWKGH